MSCSTNNSSLLPIGPAGPQGNAGPTGPAGANGADGTNGVVVLYSTTSPVSNATNVLATLQSYSIPANTLVHVGDSIEIVTLFDVDITTGLAPVYIYVANNITHIKVPSFLMTAGIKYMEIRTTITKQSNTTVFVVHNSTTVTGTYQKASLPGGTASFETGISTNDTLTSSNLIEIKGYANSFASNTITCRYMKVTLYTR